MTKVHCSIPEQSVNPLFEVFDGGDFVLSSYHDIESDRTEMRVYMEDPSLAPDAARRLKDALAVVGVDVEVETSEVPDEDWKLSYRRHFKTEKIARRLVTVPTWEAEEFRASTDPDLRARIPVFLDPGLAFGTGKHETTRACLEYIDELLQPPATNHQPPPTFLDMGCGSGILSIAAAKLGYSKVSGFDIDEDAVQASKENAELNGVVVDFRLFALGKGAVTLDDTIEASKGLYPDLALQGRASGDADSPFSPADVVVANILGPLLIAFADEIASYAKKNLIVSGILTELYPEVLSAYTARGFSEVSRKTIGEWTTGSLRREVATAGRRAGVAQTGAPWHPPA